MSDIAIRVENLSKLYHIGRAQQRHDTLRDALEAVFSFQSSVFSRRSHPGTDNCELKTDNSQLTTDDSLLWALKDVSFEVQRGEVVGIIGRNGAGKSTLLKILSRITEPTSGRAEIHGRVGSLLEVGTGFHPELTGRENIYLNGAILGMHRVEIQRRFDEIVAFSEIERFLDTPVKRYSSGMYVRLAFAVAAHLEPEILLVDEVLAVGDISFQKKCLGKMGNVAKEGRTVLFVSHNMGAIGQLCHRAILIRAGQCVSNGDTSEVISSYLNTSAAKIAHVDLSSWTIRSGNDLARFEWVSIAQGLLDGNRFFIGDSIRLRFGMKFVRSFEAVRVAVSARDSQGTPILFAADVDSDFRFDNPNEAEEVELVFDNLMLYPDTYYFTLWVADLGYDTLDRVDDCISLEIVEGGPLVRRRLPRSQAVLFTTPRWTRRRQ